MTRRSVRAFLATVPGPTTRPPVTRQPVTRPPVTRPPVTRQPVSRQLRGPVVIPAQRVAWTGESTPARPAGRAALLGAVAVVAVAQLAVAVVGHPAATSRQARTRAGVCAPAWSTAWQTPEQPVASPAGLGGNILRVVVTPQVAGSQVRARLSDADGSGPVVVASSVVARAEAPTAGVPLRFGGRAGVTIPPGVEVLSDPVPLDVEGGAPLEVSLVVTAAPAVLGGHVRAQETSWLAPGADGGAAAGAGAGADGGGARTPLPSIFLLTGLDVLAPRPVDVVVAVGDSITDGVGSAPGTHERWTDALSDRLAAAGGPALMAVLNAGISRNQLLADDPADGVSPLARFAGDVGDAAGATDVVLHVGTNDIAAGRSAVAIEAGFAAYADRVRAAGRRVFLTTITPSTNGVHGTPVARATRNAVDAWVLAQGRVHADGVFDFAAAVADRDDPDRLAPAFDAGDGLHLSAAGNRALAADVDLRTLTGSPCLAGARPGSDPVAGRQLP